MKKLLLFLSFVVSINVTAQVPQYYSNALGLNGQPLRVALYNIIKSHQSLGYSGLWNAYLLTDKKSNGKVWDIYSDRPGVSVPMNIASEPTSVAATMQRVIAITESIHSPNLTSTKTNLCAPIYLSSIPPMDM